MMFNSQTREPFLKGKASTVDLLVLTGLDQLPLKLQILLLSYTTSFLNEEVNRTEPSPSVSVPWSDLSSTTKCEPNHIFDNFEFSCN